MSPRTKKSKLIPYDMAVIIAMRFFRAGELMERERWQKVLTAKLREWGYVEEEA